MENRPPQVSDTLSGVGGVLRELSNTLMSTSPMKNLSPTRKNKYREYALENEEKAKGDITSIIEEHSKMLEDSFGEKLAKLEAKFEAKFDTSIKSLNTKVAQLESDNKTLKTKVAQLESDNKILRGNNKTLNMKVAQLELDNKTLRAEVKSLRGNNKTLKTEVAQLQSDNKTLNTKVAQLQSDNKTLKAEVKSLKTKVAQLESDNKILRGNNKTLNTKFVQTELDNKTLNTKVARLESDNKTLKTKVARLESDNKTLKTKVARLDSDNKTLKTKVVQLDSDNKTLTVTLATINRKVEAVEQHLEVDATDYTLEKVLSTLAALQNEYGDYFMILLVNVSSLKVDEYLHKGVPVPLTGIVGRRNFEKNGVGEAVLVLALPRQVVTMFSDGNALLPYEVMAQLSPTIPLLSSPIRLVNTAIKLVLLFEHDRGASQQEPLQLSQVSITGDLSQSNMLEHDPSQQEPLQLSQVSITESPVLSSSRHEVVVCNVELLADFLDIMKEHVAECEKHGRVYVNHYTCLAAALSILKNDGDMLLAMHGQGDGGVYCTTSGPGTFGVGTDSYEDNIISECFGAEHGKEYKGKNKFDVVIVYSSEICVLDKVPNRKKALMIHKSLVRCLLPSNEGGYYYLTRLNILGAYTFHGVKGSDQHLNLLRELEQDNAAKVMDKVQSNISRST